MVNSLYIVHPGWTQLGVRLQDLRQGREPQPATSDTPPLPYPIPYLGEEQAGAAFCGASPNPRDPRVYHRLEEASAARTGDAGAYWTWAAEPCARCAQDTPSFSTP
ncbi:hypothetical protein AB0D33_04240 [Streptomyces sp. NPDC048404]|uniref:hypothetical protein n=1 Tax=unclassified Streptomyces TaxID=2593676 RepID=UPI003426C862